MSKHTLLLQLSIAELDEIVQNSVKKALSSIDFRKSSTRKDKMNIDELCARYKLKKSSVYDKASKNQIPHIKVGKRLLFDEHDIERWLEGKKRGGVE